MYARTPRTVPLSCDDDSYATTDIDDVAFTFTVRQNRGCEEEREGGGKGGTLQGWAKPYKGFACMQCAILIL